MQAPTAKDIRVWSKVPFAEFGYPAPPSPEEDDPLEIYVQRSVAEFQRDTRINLAEVNVEPVGAEWTDKKKQEELGQELLIGEAVQMYTEWRVGSSQPEILESVYDFDIIQSFSAGNYSETRRGFAQSTFMRHPWPRLNRLLLLISGNLDGGEVPVVGAEGLNGVGVDWERQRYIMGLGIRRFGEGFIYRTPWDGGMPNFP